MPTIKLGELYQKRFAIDPFFRLDKSTFANKDHWTNPNAIHDLYLKLIKPQNIELTLILQSKPIIMLYENNNDGPIHTYFNGYKIHRDDMFYRYITILSYLSGWLHFERIQKYYGYDDFAEMSMVMDQKDTGSYEYQLLTTPFKDLPEEYQNKVLNTSIPYQIDNNDRLEMQSWFPQELLPPLEAVR